MRFYGRPQDALVALGERVRALRLVRQLTQEELAKRAGVSVQTIHRLEVASRSTTIAKLFRIAFALRVEPALDQLFALPEYTSLDEAMARPAILKRKRAPRRR